MLIPPVTFSAYIQRSQIKTNVLAGRLQRNTTLFLTIRNDHTQDPNTHREKKRGCSLRQRTITHPTVCQQVHYILTAAPRHFPESPLDYKQNQENAPSPLLPSENGSLKWQHSPQYTIPPLPQPALSFWGCVAIGSNETNLQQNFLPLEQI